MTCPSRSVRTEVHWDLKTFRGRKTQVLPAIMKQRLKGLLLILLLLRGNHWAVSVLKPMSGLLRLHDPFVHQNQEHYHPEEGHKKQWRFTKRLKH